MEADKYERCRLCLSDDIINYSIFDPRDDGISLSTKIMLCTTIMVTADDQYSKYVCVNCADMLDLFFHFRNTCFKTLLSMHNEFNDITENNIDTENGEKDDDHEDQQIIYERYKDSEEPDKGNQMLSMSPRNTNEMNVDLGIDKVVSEEIVFDERGNEAVKDNLSVRQFQVGCYVSFVNGDADKELPLMRRFKCISCKKVFPSLNELDDHWDVCEEWMNTVENDDTLRELINVDNDNPDDNVIYEDEEIVEDCGNYDENYMPKKNSKNKEFCCETCGKVFKQLWLLTRHIQVKHIQIRPYSCPHCPRRFFDKYELKYHQRLHEDVEDFCCNVCGRRFARRSGLRAHMRSHTGEKPYDCHTCGKSFAHLNSLITHERVHTGERPYTCKYCPRTFAQFSTARSHEEMHMGGLRLHQCEVCDRMYKTEKELRAHFITHEGALDHRCDSCNKGFKKLTELRKHNQRYHYEKKPFSCPDCSKSYMTARELQAHNTVHTGELPFTCLFCSKRYRLKSTLRKHMDKHHKGAVPETETDTKYLLGFQPLNIKF